MWQINLNDIISLKKLESEIFEFAANLQLKPFEEYTQFHNQGSTLSVNPYNC